MPPPSSFFSSRAETYSFTLLRNRPLRRARYQQSSFFTSYGDNVEDDCSREEVDNSVKRINPCNETLFLFNLRDDGKFYFNDDVYEYSQAELDNQTN